MEEYRMRKDIKEYLDYLEFGEDNDICKKVSRIRKYIEEILLKNELLEEVLEAFINK